MWAFATEDQTSHPENHLMRPVVASNVSETQYVAKKESSKGARQCRFTRFRVLLGCLVLTGSVCLTVYSDSAFCSDQPAEIPVGSPSTAQSAAVAGLTKRPVTVADSIQMTRLGDPSYTNGAPSKGVAKFSPDGKRFVVILRKGNLEANTNEYSLVLFQTSAVFQSPEPQVLVSLASSSNRPAIDNVLWLDDNDTILFLGEHPGEQTQLYSLKCSSKELTKLTSSATNLTSFVTTANGKEIVFTAKSAVSTFLTAKASRNGIAVTSEDVTDLIRGSYGGKETDDDTLSIKQLGREAEAKITISGRIGSPPPLMSLSPDGAYLLLQTMATHVSDTWSQYDDRFLLSAIRIIGMQGSLTNLYQYELVNTHTGVSQVLLDTPISPFGSEMAWSADSKSVVVSDVYLPLDVDDPAERALRKAHTFLVELKIPSRQFIKISHEDLKLVSWDPKTGDISCDAGRIDSDAGKTTPRAYFRKSGETWSQASGPGEIAAQPLPDIVLDEGMNKPPHIVAIDPPTGRKSMLMDLNPQFENLALARVEEIALKAGHGTEVKGGLYWPPDYVPGKKYPLVIQTHGWSPKKFWMDGPYTTAFAAQSLAGKGFFVLQVSDPDWHLGDTPKEVQVEMAAYESAIDYLDRKGLIDRNRVGITGFSRTCWYVTYTLTHSKHPFAAAAIADGVDYGYFQYALSNLSPAYIASFEDVNGAPPFAKGLQAWLTRSPSFLMDRIETPLRVQAIGPGSLLGEWPWLTGLFRLAKPVELVYIPDGVHILEKPWDRMVSQQGDVDWFGFWVKGEEDPDPTKAEQYKRWRELRTLHEAGTARRKLN
jgi:hypothetical protein